MKKGIGGTRETVFRPKEVKERLGLHGRPPADINPNCFLLVDAAAHNGEVWFYRKIKPFIKSIYDVGADTTFYTNFCGEVHYFEPIDSSNIFEAEKVLKRGNNILKNKKSYFNNFGLSTTTDKKKLITWEAGDVIPNPDGDDVHLGDNLYMETMRGDDYITSNNFLPPDFVSIDTEGHELDVVRGFGSYLSQIKVIQFEYGGTWYSAGIKMEEMLNLLKKHGFNTFAYIIMKPPHGLVPLNWTTKKQDHYAYCNVVCINSTEKELLWELKM